MSRIVPVPVRARVALPPLALTAAALPEPELPVVQAAMPVDLAVATDEFTLYTGDTVSLVAAVRDAGAATVPVAPPVWHAVDPRIAEVVGDQLRARRAGRTTLVVQRGSLSAIASVRVQPALHLRIVDVDGAAIANAHVLVNVAGSTRVMSTDSSGRAIVTTNLSDAESVHVEVEPPAGRPLHAATFSVNMREIDDRVGVVLLPTIWRIRGGLHEGAEVAVRAASARATSGSSFARLVTPSGPGAHVVGWPKRRLPLRLVVAPELLGADTASFWATARDVERDLGMRLFVRNDSSNPAENPIVLRHGHGFHMEAMTHTTWSGSGEVFDAEILVSSAAMLRDRRVMAHELLHALGFGHTTAWQSIVAPGAGQAPPWLTRDDVAWVQLLLRLRETQERLRAPFGLDAAR